MLASSPVFLQALRHLSIQVILNDLHLPLFFSDQKKSSKVKFPFCKKLHISREITQLFGSNNTGFTH